MRSKKIIFIVLITLLLITSVSYAIYNYHPILSQDKALKLGEKKYLEFLWMVDGVFSNTKYKVNDKEIKNSIISKPKDNSFVIDNFEEVFHNLFVNSISYNQVYGDGISFSWYKKENDKYIFSPDFECSNKKMGINHEIKVLNINRNEILYSVFFKDIDDDKEYKREFVLTYENHKWKISKAYYHDSCRMDYYIA